MNKVVRVWMPCNGGPCLICMETMIEPKIEATIRVGTLRGEAS